MHASEFTLLFPHFIECVIRLILLRYEPVVPQAVVDDWKRGQEDYQKYYGGGRNDGGGDGAYPESGGSFDSRRMSRASSSAEPQVPKR